MKKHDVVSLILKGHLHGAPQKTSAKAYAPTNIALCKYWGKRDSEINLPVTSSLSISLGSKGAETEILVTDNALDIVFLNQRPLDLTTPFGRRLIEFLNLFRKNGMPRFIVNIETNVPVAAGLASSACGFAALVKVLNELYGWELKDSELSILARLGSGSACRSLWQGFVEWTVGMKADGMDSFAEPISEMWPELCVGLVIVSDQEKALSSRDAMQRTVSTGGLYSAWPNKVSRDMPSLKQAISVQDFQMFGKTAESNAMNMHATMLSAWPPITYMLPETLQLMRKVWALRHESVPVYFTQDAGPNLKLLFLDKEIETIKTHFPRVEILQPFKDIEVLTL